MDSDCTNFIKVLSPNDKSGQHLSPWKRQQGENYILGCCTV
jgi:hypothetical protein